MQLAVFQRTNEGGELYNANIGGFQKKTYRETYKRGVRPTDQYGSYGTPRRNLPEFMRLIDRNCRVTGVPCESPFMYWRASMGRECLEGCPSGVWGDSAAWVWCSAGCPLDQQPPTPTAAAKPAR
jgi:hypothetical protein